MCRLYALRANALTKVECTLVRAQNALLLQSKADLRGEAHPDGWGISFYERSVPSVERRDVAAYRDAHFSVTAERVYVRTVVAHVRQATVGGRSLSNTHPFAHGRWTFAHNGTVQAFDRVGARMEREIPRELLRHRRGSTDSEVLFYWLLTRMARAGIPLHEPLAEGHALVRVVRDGVRTLDAWCRQARAEEPARLNFLLTDGVHVVASRWHHTLHLVIRDGVRDCDICGIPHVHRTSDAPYRAAVVASEPISDEPWQEVPDESIVSIDAAIRTEVNPI